MKRLGFVTSLDDPTLISDDRLVFPHLERKGFAAESLIWDTATTSVLDSFDGLVFRSCWNYHRKHELFLEFLERVRGLQIPVFNPVSVIEWNLNKKHILEFDGAVKIPKTRWLPAGTSFSAKNHEDCFAEWQFSKLVVKPAVSLNGQDTYLISKENARTLEPIITELVKTRDILIQEYIPEIKTAGETSLVFFNKKLSHAVRKVPSAQEFRVHSEYGGTRKPTKAPADALKYAETILNHISEPLLYARVDLVESASGPVLIELEVTDPMLYLASDAHAAERFASAIELFF